MDRNLQNLIQLKNQLDDLRVVLLGYAWLLNQDTLKDASSLLNDCVIKFSDFVLSQRNKIVPGPSND